MGSDDFCPVSNVAGIKSVIMTLNSNLAQKPLRVGFYQCKQATTPLTEVHYKPTLKADEIKERSVLDLTTLYHPKSTYPPHTGSLEKKTIQVKAVHYYPGTRQVSHAEWTILSKETLEQLVKQANALTKATIKSVTSNIIYANDLPLAQRLALYDKVKKDPAIQLADGLEEQSQIDQDDSKDSKEKED